MRKSVALITILCFLCIAFYINTVKSNYGNQIWLNKDIIGTKYQFLGINNIQLIFANKDEKTKEFNIFALNKSNGKVMWQVALEKDAELFDLKCDNNNVLLKLLHGYKDDIDLEQDCDIVLLSAITGKLRWKKTYTARHSPILSITPSEVFLDNERIFFTHNDTLYVFNTNKGELIFEYTNKKVFISPICPIGKNILLLKNFGGELTCVNEQGESWKLLLEDNYFVNLLCDRDYNCSKHKSRIYGKTLYKETPYISQGTTLYVVAGKKPDNKYESPIIVKVDINTGKILEEIDCGIDLTVSDIYMHDQYIISNNLYFAPINLDKYRIATLSYTGETLYMQDEKAGLNYYIIDVVDNKILSCDLDNKTLLTQKPNGTIDAIYKPEDSNFTNIVSDGKNVFLFYDDKIICLDLSSMFYDTYQAKLQVDNKAFLFQDSEKIEMKNPVKLINNRVFCTLEPILKISNTFTKITEDKIVIQSFTDVSKRTIIFKINNCIAEVNNKQKQIDPYNKNIYPIVVDNTHLFPLRFLGDAIGCEVKWEPDTNEIILIYNPKISHSIQPNTASINKQKVR